MSGPLETVAPTRVPRKSVSESYRAHPLLDPNLPRHNPAMARLWIDAWRRLSEDDRTYLSILRAYTKTPGGTQPAAATFSQYFHDADAYILDLLRLVPNSLAKHLAPLPETRGLSSLRDLLRATFEGRDPRARYEAQRKLYLAKLLFDIDHCRSIRDGLRHRDHFETILQQTLWHDAQDGGETEICAALSNQGGGQQFAIGVPATPQSRCWKFRVRRLPTTANEAEVDVYHYRARYKREADPAIDARNDEGLLRIAENPRWPGLGRRSGSILSKMIRRGIHDPRQVQDVLGAMFIVGNRRQAYALEKRLMYALGGPLRWRDRVDTLSNPRDRVRLDTQSSSGFLVLKEIVDVLMEDPSSSSPYLFSVEIQIFPLEAYLRTLYDTHFASHTAYKKRQFLNELLPLLFPPQIFGGHEVTF